MKVEELIEMLKLVPQDAILIDKNNEIISYAIIKDRLLLSGYSEYADTAMLIVN